MASHVDSSPVNDHSCKPVHIEQCKLDAGYAPLLVERGVKAFPPRGLVLTFGYTFGVNEAGLRLSSNFPFSSNSFIRFSRSPSNSSVGTSGALVNPLYWGISPQLVHLEICSSQ